MKSSILAITGLLLSACASTPAKPAASASPLTTSTPTATSAPTASSFAPPSTPAPSPSASPKPGAIPKGKSTTKQTTSPEETTSSEEALSSDEPPLSIESTLQKIDRHMKRRNEESEARAALALSRELYASAPKNPQVAWRYGMACYIIAFKFSPGDDKKDAREELYEEGLRITNETLEADPNCGPCHFWAGVNIALRGDSIGPFKMLGSIGDIREHAEKAAALDPTHAGAGPYRLLGQLEQALPGILGGSDKQALKYFEKAVATVPNDPINYPYLVKMLEKRDEHEEAMRIAKIGLALPKPAPDQYESQSSVVELEEWMSAKSLTK